MATDRSIDRSTEEEERHSVRTVVMGVVSWSTAVRVRGAAARGGGKRMEEGGRGRRTRSRSDARHLVRTLSGVTWVGAAGEARWSMRLGLPGMSADGEP